MRRCEPTWKSVREHPVPGWFRDEKFDPDEWVALFKDAGARFAGPTAQLHELDKRGAPPRRPGDQADQSSTPGETTNP